jgi:hypothetical protein
MNKFDLVYESITEEYNINEDILIENKVTDFLNGLISKYTTKILKKEKKFVPNIKQKYTDEYLKKQAEEVTSQITLNMMRDVMKHINKEDDVKTRKAKKIINVKVVKNLDHLKDDISDMEETHAVLRKDDRIRQAVKNIKSGIDNEQIAREIRSELQNVGEWIWSKDTESYNWVNQ